ncbi:hypothetical protein E2P81_ATG00102 [Venturia nashicola]|uniref:Uncharacterized protein n=1 Tax=Venturia nashicola TaxID=86259 RepID=A0A4Z1PVX7_9PEZI|nr:hypothetical protein E6O75_ATG00109 [Venturia nashicola]TLD39115.1 hypothetical protein E2P81_ATG00102 [Venturia nashicola]
MATSKRPSPPSILSTSTTTPDFQPSLESPSLSTPQARARFEFEPGKSNNGTKILMLEWEDTAETNSIAGSRTVSWEGKSHVLPAEERSGDAAIDQTHRLFFLLPPGVSVPATVTLTLEGKGEGEKVVWKTNPLPAIFPPGLYERAVSPGPGGVKRPSKGVLHTLWAKKRLATLEGEIVREERDFPEGIGLDMALKEKEWIESTFGITASAPAVSPRAGLNSKGVNDAPLSPTTPLSPGGSRLSEKFKGLKLQTGAPASSIGRGPLSPDAGDIAVSSFAVFKGERPLSSLAAKPAQTPQQQPVQPSTTPLVSLQPQPWRRPVLVPQRTNTTGSMGSLAGMLTGAAPDEPQEEEAEEGDLFAMPLSPRSPDMTKSPFSFDKADVRGYVKTTS